jgi:NAD(P)-dependent dehydrogenase (short-subunit alcohol dehydrogenase family)
MRIAITGATDGIGKETARQLARRGHHIVMIGRPGAKSEEALRQVGKEASNADVHMLTADLGVMSSVRALADRLAEEYPDLQVLVNNAAVIRTSRNLTVDGFEETLAINYLSHFLLTHRLLATLTRNAPARIVNVSSMVHETGRLDLEDLQSERHYSASEAYAQSKVAMVLFTRELSTRLKGTGVTVNALHPGVINTKLLHVLFSGGSPIEQGAETPVFLAVDPSVEGKTGLYWVRKQPAPSPYLEGSPDLARALWAESEKLLEPWV